MAEPTSAISYVIHKAAERKLQQVAIAICDGLTPEHMELMAKKNLTLAQLLQQTGHTIPKVSALARPGVDYLVQMPDEDILRLLEEKVPDNVAVLRRYPNFCRGVIRDLKAFASG
mgnify:CR=1 FL=1